MKKPDQGEEVEKTGSEKSIELNQKISRLVSTFCRAFNMTQEDFGRKLGYTRPNFNQILNSKTTARQWKLPALCTAAKIFGVTVGELIQAADEDRGLPLRVLLANTSPGSKERLDLIIADAVQSEERGDSPTKLFGVFGLAYSAQLLKAVAPDICHRYEEGAISDIKIHRDILEALKQEDAYIREHPQGEEVKPFWTFLNG